MKFLKWLVTTLVILAAIIVGGSFLLPANVQLERSTVIDAPPGEIFPYVNNYRKFNEWSPWVPRDPDAQYTFSGPDQGVGAKMAWASDQEDVGSGSQEIIESTPDKAVVTALDFGEMGTAQAGFELQPEGAGTKVTWSLQTPETMNPVSRWMGLLLDGLIGADYEEGLARLKKKVETGSV